MNMNALIIDRDEMTAELLSSRLQALGFNVEVEPSKERALSMVSPDSYGVIFVDPAPMREANSFIRSVRRSVGRSAYVFLMTADEDLTQDYAIAAGANNIIYKPFRSETIQMKMADATQLLSLSEHLANANEDFPSAGGVIAKSAINQLFLSSLERAERYGDRLFMIFISLSNYEDIKRFDGPQAANFAAAKMAQHIVRMRRQTDIVGQTRQYEYVLLLQRPERVNEPSDAAKRFADSFAEINDIAPSPDINIEIKVSLVAIPTGMLLAEYTLPSGDGSKDISEVQV